MQVSTSELSGSCPIFFRATRIHAMLTAHWRSSSSDALASHNRKNGNSRSDSRERSDKTQTAARQGFEAFTAASRSSNAGPPSLIRQRPAISEMAALGCFSLPMSLAHVSSGESADRQESGGTPGLSQHALKNHPPLSSNELDVPHYSIGQINSKKITNKTPHRRLPTMAATAGRFVGTRNSGARIITPRSPKFPAIAEGTGL